MQSVNSDQFDMTDSNITMPNNSELICPVVDTNTGDVCGEKTGLQILNEFRDLYEARIQSVNPNSPDVLQEKMNIMMEWIKDLDAQNTMLVRTVEELEEAACCRVKMLEEKLKQTSIALTNNMSQYGTPSETIIDSLSKRINELETNEKELKLKIVNFKCDIRGLLELIRRREEESCWRFDGIKFFEIDQHDIPIPAGSIYGQEMGNNKSIENMTQQLQSQNKNEIKSLEYQHELHHKSIHFNDKFQNRDEKIKKIMSKSDDHKKNFQRQTDVNADFKNDTIRLSMTKDSDYVTIKNSNEDNQEKSDNLDGMKVCQLQNELAEKKKEITLLTQQYNKLEKENMESREALTHEVADKHDAAMNFKQRAIKLEEQGRQLIMQLHFKEDIIREMRREIKVLKMKVGAVSSNSPNKRLIKDNTISQKVAWDDNISGEVPGQMKADNICFLSAFLELKAMLNNEHHVLKEKIQELHDIWYHTTLMEKATYDKYLAIGQSKLDDIIAIMDKNRSRINENSDNEKTTINGAFHCTDKLIKVIDALSDLCMDKGNEILKLEFTLQNVREKNDEINNLSQANDSIQLNPNIIRQQFNEMEEFRVCTVEAQAAIEDLKEEIDTVICNLNCRQQLFIDLCKSIDKIQDIIARAKQNISTVINTLKDYTNEKILGNDTIKLTQQKLKELKNQVNDAQSNVNSLVNYRDDKSDIYASPYDKIVVEVECIVYNLQLFVTKDDCGISLLENLHDYVNNVKESLDEIQRVADRVLQENKVAQNVIDDKKERLDKLEQELDYAHTKMQETLENIIFVSQHNESVNKYSSNDNDDTLSMNNKSNDISQEFTVEMDKQKHLLSSKDKLLEHKDEIIRIQNDSIMMTQGEYKDLRERLQSKIDAQASIMNQYMNDKIKLLEQNQLQSQTIKHLQDAVVDAKKNLNRQLPQRSAMDLGIGDDWNRITPPVFNNGNVHDV